MKLLFFAVILFTSTAAYAEGICVGSTVLQAAMPVARSNHHCVPFNIAFPWGTCYTNLCWNGGPKAYPKKAKGVVCGTKVVCSRVGNTKRYRCKY